VEAALASCRQALENYVRESEELGEVPLDGYSIDEIQFRLDKMSLVYNHGVLNYPFVDTQIGLYLDAPAGTHFRGIDPIGCYRLIITLDGQVDDDYLEIDEVASDSQLLPVAFEMIPFETTEARKSFLDRFITRGS
jgi:hypothetical protein